MQAVDFLNEYEHLWNILATGKHTLGDIRKGNVEFWWVISVYKDSEIIIISSLFLFSFQSS